MPFVNTFLTFTQKKAFFRPCDKIYDKIYDKRDKKTTKKAQTLCQLTCHVSQVYLSLFTGISKGGVYGWLILLGCTHDKKTTKKTTKKNSCKNEKWFKVNSGVCCRKKRYDKKSDNLGQNIRHIPPYIYRGY